MYSLYPVLGNDFNCSCGGRTVHNTVHWQGIHTCSESLCLACKKTYLVDFDINQSTAINLLLDKATDIIYDRKMNPVTGLSWLTDKLLAISHPSPGDIEVSFEQFQNFENIVVLNAFDYVYGHALFDLLNLNTLIQNKTPGTGLVVIVQPMMKWLLPKAGIDEIWTVGINFKEACNYYQSVSDKINARIRTYKTAGLAKSKILDTRTNIRIEAFTGVMPFDYQNKPAKPRITVVWREDYGRLWIRNIYFHKGLVKAGLGKLLLPLHFLRVLFFLQGIRRKLGNGYAYTVAGLGTSFRFPSGIEDCRVERFSEDVERNLCKIYAESELVTGVHGSGMLLPSAHAGMVISMMPSKRWGNFAEDILMVENDKRLSFWQRRILPVNMGLTNVVDCAVSMIKDRKMFTDKFYDVLW